MAKTSQEVEQEFIDGLKETTGKALRAWMTGLKKSAPSRRNDAIAWLKSRHGFGHMNTSLLMGIYVWVWTLATPPSQARSRSLD